MKDGSRPSQQDISMVTDIDYEYIYLYRFHSLQVDI